MRSSIVIALLLSAAACERAAPGFTQTALDFHHTADGIAAAARGHDREAVLRALSATLQTCTSCHATWRQHVVDDAEWTRVTASAPPAGHHP